MYNISLITGDGIGPEIMDATLQIIKAAGAVLEYDEMKLEKKYIYREILQE